MRKIDSILSKLNAKKGSEVKFSDSSESDAVLENKPLTFKEVVKNNNGNEAVAVRQLIGNILASSNSQKIFMEVAKVLKNSMKDTDALGYDAATGQEVSKGAIKDAFRQFLGL